MTSTKKSGVRRFNGDDNCDLKNDKSVEKHKKMKLSITNANECKTKNDCSNHSMYQTIILKHNNKIITAIFIPNLKNKHI